MRPNLSYRGKFALRFFSKWLEALRNDRLSDEPKLFSDAPKAEFHVSGDFSFDKLVTKAPAPPALAQFLARIP